MHEDHRKYAKFTTRARLDKSVNSLLGIIEGISIDGEINELEVGYLELWLSEHEELRDLHPYNEFVPVVTAAVADHVLSQDERDDIVWLCERLRSEEFYDRTTADLQRLHAILGGIVADTRISETELRGLSDWLGEHDHLKLAGLTTRSAVSSHLCFSTRRLTSKSTRCSTRTFLSSPPC
ncbi:hypothetical protein [Luteimonas sp. A649]